MFPDFRRGLWKRQDTVLQIKNLRKLAKGGECKRDYINEDRVNEAFAEIIKHIIIPEDVKSSIVSKLKEYHTKQSGYSKEVKTNLQREISVLENRIENSLELKLDGNLNHEDWVRYNKKWQNEKDKLLMQLQEINDLDKQFYDQTGTLLGFLDNAHDLFLKGTMAQRRKIMEIISEKIVYKDKNFDIKLRPVFQELVENYNLIVTMIINIRLFEWQRCLLLGRLRHFPQNENEVIEKSGMSGY